MLSLNSSGLTGSGLLGHGWIIRDGQKADKSISMSTVDLAYKKAVEMAGKVSGPKSLGIHGVGSYLYPMLIRFGVIKQGEA